MSSKKARRQMIRIIEHIKGGHERAQDNSHNEEEMRWAGVFIAVVGATLVALSFTLDGGPL
jgi:hypothetical protein